MSKPCPTCKSARCGNHAACARRAEAARPAQRPSIYNNAEALARRAKDVSEQAAALAQRIGEVAHNGATDSAVRYFALAYAYVAYSRALGRTDAETRHTIEKLLANTLVDDAPPIEESK